MAPVTERISLRRGQGVGEPEELTGDRCAIVQGLPRGSHGLPLLSRQDGIVPLAYSALSIDQKQWAPLVLNADDGDVHVTQSLSRT